MTVRSCVFFLLLFSLTASQPARAEDQPGKVNLPDKAECQKHHQEEADRYTHAAVEYNKLCEKLKGEEVLSEVREVKKGYFCGFPAFKKAPKTKADKEAYLKAGTEYERSCSHLLKQKALARISTSGVDCSYSGVLGPWITCPGLK
jgi:hypothetical protein